MLPFILPTLFSPCLLGLTFPRIYVHVYAYIAMPSLQMGREPNRHATLSLPRVNITKLLYI